MSEFLDVQEQIVTKIKEMADREKFYAFDGAIPSGAKLRAQDGRYYPYVIFGLGGKTEAANRMQGIGSSRDDVKWTSLVLYCVGDDASTVRKLKDIFRTEFEGYEPTVGWGEFSEVLTGDFGISKPDPDLIPLRFGETMAFKALTDI